MKKYFRLLGYKVKDKITGFEGICDSVCFDLYGCVLLSVRPPVSKDKPTELAQGNWFDEKRIEAVSENAIFPVPSFDAPPGPAEKSMPVNR